MDENIIGFSVNMFSINSYLVKLPPKPNIRNRIIWMINEESLYTVLGHSINRYRSKNSLRRDRFPFQLCIFFSPNQYNLDISLWRESTGINKAYMERWQVNPMIDSVYVSLASISTGCLYLSSLSLRRDRFPFQLCISFSPNQYNLDISLWRESTGINKAYMECWQVNPMIDSVYVSLASISTGCLYLASLQHGIFAINLMC